MRNTIFLVLILVILSCQNEKSEKTQNAELNTETEIIQPEKLVFNDTVIYLSENNDLALIKLTLIPNQTFDLYMKIYPEPMQDVETESENNKLERNLERKWTNCIIKLYGNKKGCSEFECTF